MLFVVCGHSNSSIHLINQLYNFIKACVTGKSFYQLMFGLVWDIDHRKHPIPRRYTERPLSPEVKQGSSDCAHHYINQLSTWEKMINTFKKMSWSFDFNVILHFWVLVKIFLVKLLKKKIKIFVFVFIVDLSKKKKHTFSPISPDSQLCSVTEVSYIKRT